MHKKGKSLCEIGKIVNRNLTSVEKIINKFIKCKKIDNFEQPGRLKRLNDRAVRRIVAEVKGNASSSALKIAETITAEEGNPFSASSVSRALHSHVYFGHCPRRKPLILKVNKKKSLNFAKKYNNCDFSFWKTVLLTDESKFEIFGAKKRKKNMAKKQQSL